MGRSRVSNRGEVLVAIINNKRDFAILREQLWYRVPVKNAPHRWPPTWVAFYQTSVFGDEKCSVRYYGKVKSTKLVSRRELFPNEIESDRASKQYHQVFLESLEARATPLLSARGRRLVFIPTTWRKFEEAELFNDLFDDSGLEDRLWRELKQLQIPAERQWHERIGKKRYYLDFALFCNHGKIDVETDGDKYHHNPETADADNERNNALTTANWSILRFTRRQILEARAPYCIDEITKTINRLGGLSDEGIVHRVFGDAGSQQLTLFG